MTAYQTLPAPLPGSPALAIFAFVLSTGITATVETLDLERALAASAGMGGAPVSDVVRAHLTEARRRIVMALHGRQADVPAPSGPAGGLSPDRPHLGPMAPLQPAPIVRPPSGAAVRAGFDF